MKNYEFRKLGQDGYCRVCHGHIPRKEDIVVVFHNSARQGGTDFICFDCIEEIYKDAENGGFLNDK